MTAPVVAFPFVGDTLGGSHFSALLLATNINGAGYRAEIILHEQGPLSAYLDQEQIPYHHLPLPNLLRGGWRVVPDLIRLARPIRRCLRALKIDLVHGNDGRVNQTWAPLSRLAGRPYVWHQRARFDGSRLRSLLASRSSAVVCVSEFAKSSLPTVSLKRNVQIVRSPFDVDAPQPERASSHRRVAEAIGASDDAPIVGFCGSLTEQKRPFVFADMAAQLLDTNKEIFFVMLGADRDGLWPTIAAYADGLGIRERIAFVGFKTPAVEWIAGMDVLVATQVEDAFPRILVEAMLAGTPAVASRSGGHAEAIEDGETGWLVEADNPEAFARAVRDVLSGDRTKKVVSLARRTVVERCSVTRHVGEIAQIYDRVLAHESG